MVTKRILIIDDEEGYRKVLSNSLADLGYETKAVKNGFEALEEMKRQRYSIILLDVKMPGMDGIELLDQIKGTRFPSQIVIITAYTYEDVAKEAVRKGAKKVIIKPFSIDDITSCLNELCAGSQGKGAQRTERNKFTV